MAEKLSTSTAALPQAQQLLLFGTYLCGGETTILVLLPCEPSDDAVGISQVFGSRRGTEFGQQHIGADLHRQRG